MFNPEKVMHHHQNTPPSVTSACTKKKIKITSWNCRGMEMGLPYIKSMIEDGSDVLVLSDTGYGRMRPTN